VSYRAVIRASIAEHPIEDIPRAKPDVDTQYTARIDGGIRHIKQALIRVHQICSVTVPARPTPNDWRLV